MLLISGIVNADVEWQAEAVGAAGIAKKPFTPAELFPQIEAALASAAPETEVELSDAPEQVPAASLPRQQQSLETLLAALLENSAVHAALFADTQDACLAQVGCGLDDGAALAVYSRTLASVAGALGEHLGLAGDGSLNSLHLDFQGHSLLITKIAARGTLLLRIKDASSIGVVRYLVRKFVEEEAQLFESPILTL